YMGWISNFANVAPIITAGSATTGDMVWTWDAAATAGSKIDNLVIADGMVVAGGVNAGSGNFHLTGKITTPGAGSRQVRNRGNVDGGITASGTSLAVGPRASTGAAIGSVALGVGATVTGNQFAVALGRSASAAASSVAAGAN